MKAVLIPYTMEETAEMMKSDNYKERFRAEYLQLRIRLNRLLNMVEAWDQGKLDFTPTCPRSTYDLQIRAMSDYVAILEARAKMEGIEEVIELAGR